MSRPAAGALVVCCLLATSLEGVAQEGAPRLRPGRPSVSVGMRVEGGYPLGTAMAALRASAPGTTAPPPFTLFRASSEMTRAAGLEARAAWPLTASLAVEASGAYSRPGITVSIASDPEGPDVMLRDTRLSQYVLEGAIVWQLSRVRLGSRARPYVAGGAAYLRQLYDGHTRVETGQRYHVGAGVRYWLRGGHGGARDVGLRGEVRYAARRGGVEFEGATRRFPVVSAGVFVGL